MRRPVPSLRGRPGRPVIRRPARPGRRCPATGAGGFSLLELLAVLAVVVLLGGMTFGALRTAIAMGRQTRCASNLRSLAAAALAFADDNDGRFPWAYRNMPGYSSWAWDFVTPAGGAPQPGALWSGYGLKGVLQCPEFVGGASNWQGDPFTGYNYNVSFLGKVEGDPAVRAAPARLAQVRDPAGTAFFGDGQYADGANKFMRAPRPSRAHDFSGQGVRTAGTQGYRHRGRTNVAFVDGRVEALSAAYALDGKRGFVSPGSGFLSPDNRLYSLEK